MFKTDWILYLEILFRLLRFPRGVRWASLIPQESTHLPFQST